MGDKGIDLLIWLVIAALASALVGACGYGYPKWRVWQKELAGKASLREAEWDRQIAVEEARAALESSKLLRQAELERAKGLAQAISEVKQELVGTPGEAYLRYRWIEGLHNDHGEIIYVPTEANLPILEAGRLK